MLGLSPTPTTLAGIALTALVAYELRGPITTRVRENIGTVALYGVLSVAGFKAGRTLSARFGKEPGEWLANVLEVVTAVVPV